MVEPPFLTERNVHPNGSPIVDGDTRHYRVTGSDRNYFAIGWQAYRFAKINRFTCCAEVPDHCSKPRSMSGVKVFTSLKAAVHPVSDSEKRIKDSGKVLT